MLHEFDCHGKIDVGDLPPDTVTALEGLAGEWLEYDSDAGAIVVRHVQPTATAIVPTVTSELVHMLAVIPYDLQEQWRGGQFLIHTEGEGRLVRIIVEPGGALHVEWAHPDYAGAEKRSFDASMIRIEPYEQRLNGRVTLAASDPKDAVRTLQELADTYEGLYPEGDFRCTQAGNGTVEVTMKDVNLDVRLLIEALEANAEPDSLEGRIALGSFGNAVPENMLRLLFENGKAWMQQPLLWEEAAK